ncbi:hypothetical protein [Nonomuraea sp. CA-141351]|uniref:hypothetical protein n=1 Tax=Nonomuraea sp. CA-141351 TaxID=3239996 RepID=UPI003D9219E3
MTTTPARIKTSKAQRIERTQPDTRRWIEHVEVDWTVGAERLRVSYGDIEGGTRQLNLNTDRFNCNRQRQVDRDPVIATGAFDRYRTASLWSNDRDDEIVGR